ncbi:uncharacterized protein FOMMEDRAFT_162183 [Fomitiporia mediterranea MF3/22]|uniref:uncharacterized protein n=1 Tax=Fomitiporia mediterranea (strain MF3/22) TaxID=694068 RepID=UPI0004408E4A|nr:uncharacterized protein FOMMEDRAFT_162183 [Fomitiporia mediterranea MF3/22]EJC97845.1 hypothetical protein FOMMEDRAFT_162183 [Fomitiporia mediterranea MF3/22]
MLHRSFGVFMVVSPDSKTAQSIFVLVNSGTIRADFGTFVPQIRHYQHIPSHFRGKISQLHYALFWVLDSYVPPLVSRQSRDGHILILNFSRYFRGNTPRMRSPYARQLLEDRKSVCGQSPYPTRVLARLHGPQQTFHSKASLAPEHECISI